MKNGFQRPSTKFEHRFFKYPGRLTKNSEKWKPITNYATSIHKYLFEAHDSNYTIILYIVPHDTFLTYPVYSIFCIFITLH